MALSGLTKDEIWLLAYNLQSLDQYSPSTAAADTGDSNSAAKDQRS